MITIVNLDEASKTTMYEASVFNCTAFLEVNRLPVPTYNQVSKTGDEDFYYRCGYYEYKTRSVNVCLNTCAAIGRAGRQWSSPGYKTDRTPYGVVAHEVGHHVDFYMTTEKRHDKVMGRETFHHKHEPVTGYEPVPAEGFAESMRLFINNPDLLSKACPNRYNYLTQILKLVPINDLDWKSTLELLGAQPRIINAASNWIS